MSISMIRIICPRFKHILHLSSTNHVYICPNSSLRSISTNSHSISVDYLINSYGLSPKSAASVFKKLQQEKTTADPNSVLNLFKSHGLSQIQIKNLVTLRPRLLLADSQKIIKPNIELLGSLGFSGRNLVKLLRKEPRILVSDVGTVAELFRVYGFSDKQIYMLASKRPILSLYDPERILKPKLEYIKSLGFKLPELAHMLSVEPYILERSLEKQIIPCVETIRRIVGTNENVVRVVKSCYSILECDLDKAFEPNVALLMSYGVPESKILRLLMIQPKVLVEKTDKFGEAVREVVKFGFDKTKMQFVLAIKSLTIMNKPLWDRKIGVYCSYGLSRDEVISAFKLQPMCMQVSEEKIGKLMKFFVNELKLEPRVISKYPNIMLFSLEKRIIPRCSVLQLLISKDLVKESTSVVYRLRISETMFKEKFVNKYQDVVPEVVEAYRGKVKFEGFCSG